MYMYCTVQYLPYPVRYREFRFDKVAYFILVLDKAWPGDETNTDIMSLTTNSCHETLRLSHSWILIGLQRLYQHDAPFFDRLKAALPCAAQLCVDH